MSAVEHGHAAAQVREVRERRRRALRLRRHLVDRGLGLRRARQLDLAVGPVEEPPPQVRVERLGRNDVERRARRVPRRAPPRGRATPHAAPASISAIEFPRGTAFARGRVPHERRRVERDRLAQHEVAHRARAGAGRRSRRLPHRATRRARRTAPPRAVEHREHVAGHRVEHESRRATRGGSEPPCPRRSTPIDAVRVGEASRERIEEPGAQPVGMEEQQRLASRHPSRGWRGAGRRARRRRWSGSRRWELVYTEAATPARRRGSHPASAAAASRRRA